MRTEKKAQIIAGGHTDVGNLRKANEDSFYVSQADKLIIVCDGMGGQVAGGLASKIAVETIKEVYLNIEQNQIDRLFPDLDSSLPDSARRLVASVRLANRRIFKTSLKFPKLRGMGTTVVALTFDDSLATMAHVGDSRILRLSDNKILQLTEDHSWLNELIADDEIDEEDIDTFSKKNVITRALGSSPAIKIDIHCEKYKKDDTYILATDGLHNAMTNDKIKKVIYKHTNQSLEKVTKSLIETAKTIDGSDNITVAMAQITTDGQKTEVMGTSKTIHEEDSKTRAKEDKFIIERFGEPKMIWGKIQMSVKTPQRIFIGSLIILFITMGIYIAKGLSTGVLSAGWEEKAPSSTNAPNLKGGGAVSGAALNSLKVGAANSTAKKSFIKRSDPCEDAVIAFILFNSEKDFRDAQLDKRGTFLGLFRPYLDVEEEPEGNLAIFLFDESGNVLHKSVGIKLPEIED